MNRICLDVTNISPGKGGAGGGITTYAKNLLLGLDNLLKDAESQKVDMLAIGHKDFLRDLKLDRIQKVYRNVDNQSFVKRNYWLHVSLPSYLRKNQIQVLHRVIPELPLVKSSKYVMTLHDFMFDFYLETPALKKYLGNVNQLKFLFLRMLMRLGVSNHDTILMPSSSIAKEARERFPDKSLNYKVTKLATNRTVIESKSNGSQGPEILLGYVAGFYPHKGHKQAIQLMKILKESDRGRNVKLFFRGSAVYQNYYEEIKVLIVNEGLSDSIFMEGFDPNITIEEIYKKYTATLLLSEYEGFGLPVLESQTFAKPVICSDIPVFKENLKDSAIYLNNNPTRQEIEMLLDKLYDSEYLDRLVEKGNENTSNYSWTTTCRETWDSYLNLL
ncbi:glycosyltransferase family 4 protein [Algoriphagus terrigena]|uniref:glycosyltransferase family 4 protein n=1 Tax=Algoriphagus terrigena TaxID=344884 RepID=UPI0003FEEFD7|nr:glycosyltransferase family 1 protein [Algoriphagus terrigena]